MATRNTFLSSPFDNLSAEGQASVLPGQQQALPPLDLPKMEQPKLEQPDTRQPAASGSLMPPPAVRPIFEAAAREFDVPVNVLMALGHQESRYNPQAIGPETQWGRARGMMQYLDDTAKGLGINPFDPAQAVPAAARQIRERLDKGYSMEDAVKEHFAGPNRKLWGKKTDAYGREVMEKVGKIGEALGTEQPTSDQKALQAQLDQEEPGRYRVVTPELNTQLMRGIENRDADMIYAMGLPKDDLDTMGKAQPVGLGGTLLESLKSGVVNAGAGIAYAPEAVLKSVEGALDGLDRVGRKLGLPEWMLERKYLGPQDIVAPLIRGKDFGSYHMAGTSDIARMVQKAGKAIESPKHAEAIKTVALTADAAMKQAVDTGDFTGVVNVLSDPQSWAVAFGQAAPSLAIAMVGGMPAMAAMEGGGALSDIKEFETKNGKVGDLEAANAIIQTTVVNTLLEKLGLDAMLGKLPGPVRQRLLGAATEGIKGRLLRGAAGATVGTLGESGTEMLQTVNENSAKRNYNQQQDLTEGVLISGMGGAGMGGPVGAVSGLASSPEAPIAQQPAPAAPQAAAPKPAPVGPQAAAPAASAAPVKPAGPLTAAVEKAAEPEQRVTVTAPEGQITGFVESYQEDGQGGFAARVLGDDGQVYQFTSADHVTITPEAPKAGPLTSAVEAVAATQPEPVEAPAVEAAAPLEAAPAEAPVETAAPEQMAQPAPALEAMGEGAGYAKPTQAAVEAPAETAQQPKALADMTEPELRERMKYIAGQAKLNGGWNKDLTASRKEVEREINGRAKPVEQVEAPKAEQSVKESLTPEPVAQAAPAQEAAEKVDGTLTDKGKTEPAAAPDKDPHAGKWFGSREKADAYVAKRKIGDTHEIVQTGKVRFEVKPKAAAQEQPVQRAKNGYAEVKLNGTKHFVTPYDDTFVIRDAAGVRVFDENRKPLTFSTEAEAIQYATANAKLKEQPNVADQRPQQQSAGTEAVGQEADAGQAAPAAVQPDAAAQEVTAFKEGDRVQSGRKRGSVEKLFKDGDEAMVIWDGKSRPEPVLLSKIKPEIVGQPDAAQEEVRTEPTYKKRGEIADVGDKVKVSSSRIVKVERIEVLNEADAGQAPAAAVQHVAGPAEEVTAEQGEAPAYTKRVFRGSGRKDKGSVYNGGSTPILGSATYYALDEKTASKYGPNIEARDVSLRNPLVIDSDQKWRSLTREAGWEFPNPQGRAEEETQRNVEALQQIVRDRGHDGVVIDFDPNYKYDELPDGRGIKTLRNVFGDPQVVVFDGATAEAKKTEPQQAAAPVEAAAPTDKLAKKAQAMREKADRIEAAGGDAQIVESLRNQAERDAPTQAPADDKPALYQELRTKLGALSERAGNIPGAGRLAGQIGGFTVGMRDTDRNLTRAWVDEVVSGYEKSVSKLEKSQPKPVSVTKAGAGATAIVIDPGAASAAAPQAEADPFAGNKLFTSDRVAAARERLKKKLSGSQLNSGIDPELLMDGIIIAGGHIESGTRAFAAYAKAMIEDIGEEVKPYLLSFYEAARNYPGLDTEGMTPVDQAKAEFDKLIQPADLEKAQEAIGEITPKPAKRTKKTGAKTDMTLTQDWGVEQIDGYGDTYDRETGNDVKDAFLKEAKSYLNTVAGILAEQGFAPDTDAKGRPQKAVLVNEGGVATSGYVTLTLAGPNGIGIYAHIGGTSLRGVVPTSQSGVSVMMRVTQEGDRLGNKDRNRWMPVDLSAADLANSMLKAVSEFKPTGKQDAATLQSQAVPARNPGADQGNAAAGDGNRQPVDAGLAAGDQGAAEVGPVPGSAEGAGAAGARGTEPAGQQPSGPARDRAGVRPEPEPTDFVIDAEDIGKGGLTKKYRDNVAAIRILKAMEAEGRVATPEERKQLAKYVGWGAMKGPFDPENKQWAKQHAELKELLTDAEFRAARKSTLDAHFTSPVAVGAMNDALARLGYKGGRMLEPSVGIGNFYGLMPAAVRNASQLYGVELDSLTSRMVAALYPKAKIAKATGFEDFQIPAQFFDLVQGNPPFGNQPLVDTERSPYSGFSIHNYFLAKGIDKLRPGGIMQVVVSHNFLDAQDNRARKWISERASLIGAVRLPNTAFQENAGTQVVTDILIFQKHDANGVGRPDIVDGWVDVAEQVNTNPKTGESVTHKVSPVFVQKPSLVLGKPSAGGTMYSANEYTVDATGDIKPMLDAWVQTLPENVYRPIERKAEAETDMAVPDGVKVGSYYVDAAGEIMQRGDDLMGNKTAQPWVAPNAKAAERMKGMIGLRETLRTQMRLERSPDATEPEIEANRATLNKLYDDFLKKNGHLNSQTNRRLFLDDTEAQLVQALEFDYDKGISKAVAEKEGIDPREPNAVKADIFNRRVAFPPQDFLTVTTPKDALLASLNYRGKVDTSYMEEVYGKPSAKIIEELGDVVFDDPQAGIVTADEYLSGDVKTKLAEAKAAGEKYRRNVEALEKVIPADKKPSEIAVSIGAAFVPAEVYQQFVTHISGGNATAAYIKATGQWLLAYTGQTDPALNTGKFGTDQLSAQELFQLSMLGRGAVGKKTVRNADGSTTTILLEKETEAAREKQNAIKAEWQSWLWSDPARADQIASIYNDKMNRIVERKYDGSHLSFPGMNPAISLLEHQKNGVWRGLQSYQVLYDHVVGAGKTFEMATLAMEMRRLGIARKPLFVVPNHLTLQWRSEFTRLYPGSNILAATPDDFAKGNRERLFSKIVTGDWDAVVVGHSSLKKIGLPEETEKAVLQEQIDEVSAAVEEMKRARGDRNIIRDMEGIRARLEAKMKDKLAAIGKRDKVVTFDELGIDAMFIDEMHEFKNLSYNSTMDRNPGMGNPAGSAKAFDLFVKTRWLFDTFGEKTPYITATGTPVSNSLVEMYNMQRYMQYPTLKKQGLHVFDAWAKQFGSVENVYEVAPSGSGYRQSTRFAKFTNLPGLMGLYNSFADTITLDDLKAQEEAQGKRFPVPKLVGGKPQIVVAKRSPAVSNLMGVPMAQTNEDGSIAFKLNLSQGDEPDIHKAPESDKWWAKGDRPGQAEALYFGEFDTEQDARMKLVEMALTPEVSVDPNSILGRFGRLRELTKETKGKVNALSLTGEANKAGLDYRLIDPAAPDFEGSKINLAVDNMVRVYKQWNADKGTQLVFCDLSIPLSARASYSSKARRLYVRDEAGAIDMKRGTMHTAEGQESLPYFVVQRGEKELKRFDVYDAASGAKIGGDFRTKQDALDQSNALLADEAKRQRWIDRRESVGEISQEAIDEYNNENDIEADGIEAFTREDIAGVSGAAKFSVYDDIKAKLIAKGIPEREIAFIHDYGTPTAKDKLFKAVNAGEIRFLLGSTPKMGAGTNVQKRLVGLHHIDAPWRPSDLEQREGRIIRRGNELYNRDPEGFEVFIGRYATEQTYDTRRWQILEHKARGIEQLRNFDGSINEIDDIEGEAANAADMKAAASGDPLILEETRLKNDVRRLEQLQAAHADDVVAMNRKAKSSEEYAKKTGPQLLAGVKSLNDQVKKHKLDKDGFTPITIDNQTFDTKESAQQEIAMAVSLVRTNKLGGVTIVYRGVPFEVKPVSSFIIVAKSPTGEIGSWASTEPFSTSGFVQRMKNYVDRLPAQIESIQASIDKSAKDAVALREEAKKPFGQAADLQAAREAYKVVQRALLAKGPAVPESQKAAVAKGIEAQKARLETMGYGEQLREFFAGQDGPKFLRATRRSTGVPKADAAAVVKAIAARWDNAPGLVVVESMQDPAIPQAVRLADQRQRQGGAKGEPKGFWYDGSAYIVSGAHDNNTDVIRTLFHEVLGHRGLRGTFGKGLDPILSQIIQARRPDVAKKAKQYGLNMANPKEALEAAEEVLADMAQEKPELGFVKRTIAAIRTWLRKNVPALKDMRLTDDEITRSYILPARAYVERGARAGRSMVAGKAMFSRSQDQTMTDAFRRWFGDSKVVDADGRPLVVYRGGPDTDWRTNRPITEFRSSNGPWAGFFSSLPEVGSRFASAFRNGVVTPVYINISKPLEVNAGGRKAREFQIDASAIGKADSTIRDQLLSGEYDGLILRNTADEGDVFVPLRPEQIKSAVGNNGDFDPTNPDIRFSREEADKLIDDASSALEESGPVAKADYIGRVVGDIGLGAKLIVHPRTVAAVHPEFTPVYRTAISQMETRDEIISELGRGVKPYDMLDQAGKESVNKALELGRLTSNVYSPDDLKKGVTNTGTRKVVVIGDDGKPKTATVPVTSLLTQPGEVIKLTDDEIQAYQGLRATFDRALDLMRDQTLDELGFPELMGKPNAAKAIRDLITEDMPADQAEKLANIAKFVAEIEQAKRAGYVPFARYGDYVVTVKEKTVNLDYQDDGAGSLTITNAPDSMAEDLLGLGAEQVAGGWKVKASKKNEVERLTERTVYSAKVETGLKDFMASRKAKTVEDIPAVREAIEKARAEYVGDDPARRIVAFKAREKKADQPVRLSDVDALAEIASIDNETWDAVRDKLADAIKSKGFRKHFFHSDNVPGYTGDFERSIADYVIGIAGYLSRRQHMKRWDNSVTAITEKSKLFEYASKYRQYVNDPQEELAMVRQIGFFSYIAGVMASAFANLTQVPMLTVPTLSQVAPTALVMKEIGRAYKDALAMMGQPSRVGLDMFDPAKAPADVRDVLMEAWDEGSFVPLETFDLMMTARQRNVGARKGVKAFNTATQVVSVGFTFAERLNRLVTFIAAARMADKPAVKANAARVLAGDALARQTTLGRNWNAKNFAEWVVDESQYRMGKANRPTMMRGVGSALMQFKGFMIQTFEAWYRMAALHGRDGQMAALASLASVVAIGGLWGLPGADDLRKLIEAAYKQITGMDLDMKTELRAWVAKTSGSNALSQMVTKGASYPLGVDLTRVGFGSVVPDSPLAAAGIPFDMLIGRPKRAFEKASTEDYMGAAAEFTPNFMKNMLVAGSWRLDGVRDKQGNLILTPDELRGTDIGMKAIGFQPSIVADVRDYEYAQRRQETAVDGLKRSYTNKIAKLIGQMERTEDEAKLKELDARLGEVYDDIAEHNATAKPEEIIQISPRAIRNRVARELDGVKATWGRERKAARGAADEMRAVFDLEQDE